ncbi:hypothetical protein BDW75DRAFT_52196 [Aspergillus navahoensis]
MEWRRAVFLHDARLLMVGLVEFEDNCDDDASCTRLRRSIKIHIWHAETGASEEMPIDEGCYIQITNLTSDSILMVTASSNGKIWLLDISTRVRLHSLTGFGYDVGEMTFLPGHKLLASLGWE